MKRMLAMLLAMAMVVTMLPVPAFADDTDEEIEVTEAVEETTEATQPEETEVPTEPETVPKETEAPAEPEETEPVETQEPTEEVPEETEPEETEPEIIEIPEEEDGEEAEDAIVLSGYCGDNLTWTLDDMGTLTISGEGAMKDYTSSSTAPWISRIYIVNTIVIEKGVTSIGDYAFYNCSSLTSVAIPGGVTSIGDYAFSYCSNLPSITIPDGVTSIGRDSFEHCSGLISVTIPTSVMVMGSSAFYGCSSVEELYISSLESWLNFSSNQHYFSNPLAHSNRQTKVYVNNILLENLIIPTGITAIPAYAFKNWDCISSITIPNSVVSIGDDAFSSCSSLEDITIPNSVESIGSGVFSGCISLSNVTISNNAAVIGDYAFSGCRNLNNVTIPDSVKFIGVDAFSECSGLTSVIIGNGVTNIGERAFSLCSKLNEIRFQGDLPYIYDGSLYGGVKYASFYGVKADVYYPAGITSYSNARQYGGTLRWIEADAASGKCGENLTWTVAGSTLIISGTGSMYDYLSKSIYMRDDSEWPYDYSTAPWAAFKSVKDVLIKDGVTSIGSNAFYNCSNIKSIVIPSSVKSIGQDAFCCTEWDMGRDEMYRYFYTSVNELYLGSIEAWLNISLGNDFSNPLSYTNSEGIKVFVNGVMLKDLVIPAGTVSIPANAFMNWRNITSVTIPDSVKSIGADAFRCNYLYRPGWNYLYYSNTRVKQLHLVSIERWLNISFGNDFSAPLSFTEVDTIVFVDGKQIKELEIPAGMERIPRLVFQNWNCITSVTIPDSVKCIDADAFWCSGSAWFEGEYGDYFQGFLGYTSVKELHLSSIDTWYNISLGNGYSNPLRGTNGDTKVYVNGKLLADLSIPAGKKTISEYAYTNWDSITEVTIPASVTAIECEAFADCSGLNSIHFLGDMPFIDYNSFRNVTAEATYPAGNNTYKYASTEEYGGKITWKPASTDLGSGTCGKNLTWVLDENGKMTITGTGAMEDYADDATPWNDLLPKIKSVVIESGVTHLGDRAFQYASNLTSVSMPETLTSCGQFVFHGCTSLTAVRVPNSLTTLGTGMFRSCSSLKTVTLPAGLKSMATWAFYGCTSLTSFTVPAGVTEIGRHTFRECTNLTSVNLSNVTKIDQYAFAGCTSLKSIEIPGTVTSIGMYAFRDSTGLKSITLPNSITDLGTAAFYGCTGLTSVTLPESLTVLNQQVFQNCSGLTSIVIPEKVTSIGVQVFSGCSSLQTVTFLGDAPKIGGSCFSRTFTANYPCSGKGWSSAVFSNTGATPTLVKYHPEKYYTESARVEPTCTEPGSYGEILCSSCGAVIKAATVIPAKGHTEVIDKGVPATCTTPGVTDGKHCSVCKAVLVEQKVIPASGHTEVVDKAVAPTCTKDGLTEGKHCSTCGTVLVAQRTIPANGHTEVVDKAVAATCTEAGKTEGKHCSVCNTVLVAQKTIPATGHTEVVDKAVEPTCTEDGKTQGKHCSVCNAVTVAQKTIPATGHTEVTDKGTPATCTAPGVTDGKHCSVCKAVLVEQKVIPAKGHTEVVDQAVAAACTETGLTEGKHCSVCKEVLVKQEVVPATGHTVVTDPAVDATCTADGKTAGKHCFVCGTVLEEQETVKALGHDYVGTATAPTCTEEGYTTFTCTRCADSFVTYRVPALGHYYNGWQSDSESHWQRCTVCGENTEKIAHTPDRPEATSDTDQLCEICGYVMQSKHTIVRISGPVTLKGGASAAYTAKVEAAAPLTDSTILWKLRSEDAAFASITAAGKLTTKAVAEPVEIVVTAYAKADPEASANYTVTLVPAAASAVIEGAHYVNLAEGKTIQLTGKVLPASAMQKGTWKSSSAAVAKVDADGLVTFLKAGTVKITFTASDGSKKAASVKITAGIPVTNLTITGAETLASGSKTTLKAAPTVKGLAWSSSNPAAATVSSTGAVTAKTVYEDTVVTITAETTDGSNVKAEHTITITPKAKDMAIRKEGKIVSGTTLYVDSDAGFLFLEAPEGSKWTSSAAKVAEVNDGIVKILKAGTATITAKSADGKQSAKVTLKISKQVNTMTLTASGETTLISGKGKVTIKAAVNSDAKTKTVTWASSDPSVASVSTTGVVTAKAGVMKNTEVTITATAKDGSGVTESIKVTVIPAATAVSIRSESAVTTADGISIRVGETLNGRTITLSKDVKIDLGAKVFPNALGAYADQTVTWKSSAAKVAKVDENGVVTALKAGSVTITVKTADGKTNTVKIKFV